MDSLAVRNTELMPALSIDEAISRYNQVVEFTKRVMKPEKDFGIIPGTDKPTLLKPGAEKLCSLFGLAPRFIILDKIVDFNAGMFYFHYSCELYRNERLIATGEGSANSKEKKYRYRNLTEKKATPEEKAAAIRVDVKSGKYGDYKVYVIENTEPFELVNTLQKMAQKRALVAAVLIAANASEFFTQDIEDMDFIDADFQEVPATKPTPKPQPKTARVPEPTTNPAEILREMGYPDIPEADTPTPTPAPAMSLEFAMSEVGSDGIAYGEKDTATLSRMANSISKKMKVGGYADDETEVYQRKLTAIQVILASRE